MATDGGRTILVPVEDTEDCAAALRWCLAHLHRPGDAYHFLHVAAAPPSSSGGGGAPSLARVSSFVQPDALAASAALEAAHAAIMDKFASAVDAVGAPYHVAIDHVPDPSTDAVADAICDRARDVGAAAVVLPAHNRGALARFFVGSVTKAVIDRCPATVAVMRQ